MVFSELVDPPQRVGKKLDSTDADPVVGTIGRERTGKSLGNRNPTK